MCISVRKNWQFWNSSTCRYINLYIPLTINNRQMLNKHKIKIITCIFTCIHITYPSLKII